MTQKEWDNFVKFIREKHHLTPDYTPDYQSVRLWIEYKRRKNNNQKKKTFNY